MTDNQTSNMTQREILLFAIASELAERDRLTIHIAAHATADDVMLAIGDACPELVQWLPSCRLAINQVFSRPDDTIPENAELALIPPVSGG